MGERRTRTDDTASRVRSPASLWTIAAGAGALIFAGAAIGNGMDRATKTRPALAKQVPSLFAVQALQVQGREAMAAGDGTAAEERGRAAVRAAPADPASTALLGAAYLATGKSAQAETAFRVAGSLGWRVPVTQAYWLGRALEIPDYRIAALRLDALLRQDPRLVSQRDLLDPMERNPAGRAAMIARMAANPNWLAAYAQLADGAPRDSLEQRAVVLDELARTGVQLGCETVAPVSSRLAALGAVSAGAQVFRAHCPVASRGLLTDGDLEQVSLDVARTPFLWQMAGYGDVAVGFSPAVQGGNRLTITNSSASNRQILSQRIAVAPGRYALTWRAGSETGGPKSGILAALSCLDAPQDWSDGTYDAAKRVWRAELTVTDVCAAPLLFIGAAPGIGAIWLEQLRLQPQG